MKSEQSAKGPGTARASAATDANSKAQKKKVVSDESEASSQSDDEKTWEVKLLDEVGFGEFRRLEYGLWARCQVLDLDPSRTLRTATGWDLLGNAY